MFVSSFLSLRQRFIAEWSITTAAEAMLVDLAVLNYYHGLRVQGWIGDSALHLEHQFFGQDAFATNGQKRGSARGGTAPATTWCGGWASSSSARTSPVV